MPHRSIVSTVADRATPYFRYATKRRASPNVAVVMCFPFPLRTLVKAILTSARRTERLSITPVCVTMRNSQTLLFTERAAQACSPQSCSSFMNLGKLSSVMFIASPDARAVPNALRNIVAVWGAKDTTFERTERAVCNKYLFEQSIAFRLPIAVLKGTDWHPFGAGDACAAARCHVVGTGGCNGTTATLTTWRFATGMRDASAAIVTAHNIRCTNVLRQKSFIGVVLGYGGEHASGHLEATW